MQIGSYRITFTAKVILAELLISLAGLCAGVSWNVYSINKKWSNLIFPNVVVAGVDLGGKTIDQGISQLQEQIISPKLSEQIIINALGKTYTLESSRVFLNNNASVVLDQAYNFGKNLGPLEKVITLKSQAKAENYNIDFNINDGYIKDTISLISSDINKNPVNASIYYNNDGTKIVNSDTKGIKLDEVMLEKELKNKLSDLSNSNIKIEAPVEEITPGISKDILSEVDSKIASFSTSYYGSIPGRAHNIELAAKAINGKLIMPGESFSFNETVGERTRERGFMEAPVIIGVDIDSGLGGGICQVSSTLYNAILNTGINSDERIHHTLPSDYVPLGQDATVDWNNIDYKFTNTLGYPIYIQAYTENKQLFINIFSDHRLLSKKYTIDSIIYEVIDAPVQVLDNPNLEEGAAVVTQKGYQGYKVRVVRNTWENEVKTNTEVISDDFYKPVTKIISRGIQTVK